MECEKIEIGGIPALLWGPDSGRVMIAVHGSGSSKDDVPIAILAEEAAPRGWQVLSFDLPRHGERRERPTLCKARCCVPELEEVLVFARRRADELSLWANSLGAYFSLVAYRDVPLRQALFLSPVVDMERLLQNMMRWSGISEERLRAEGELPTAMGETLYWDDYQYVQAHPVDAWGSPTAVLYGGKDALCERDRVSAFAEKFGCRLTVAEGHEHYFHTPEDLAVYRAWLRENLQ